MVANDNVSMMKNIANVFIFPHGMTTIQVVEQIFQSRNMLFAFWVFEFQPSLVVSIGIYLALMKINANVVIRPTDNVKKSKIKKQLGEKKSKQYPNGAPILSFSRKSVSFSSSSYWGRRRKRRFRPKLTQVAEDEQYQYDFLTSFHCLNSKTRRHEPYQPGAFESYYPTTQTCDIENQLSDQTTPIKIGA